MSKAFALRTPVIITAHEVQGKVIGHYVGLTGVEQNEVEYLSKDGVIQSRYFLNEELAAV